MLLASNCVGALAFVFFDVLLIHACVCYNRVGDTG